MSKVATEISNSVRRAVALQLLELGAVKVNLDQPFKLTSGNFSPIYINCRQLISSTAFVDLFCAAARQICEETGVVFDILAGGESAGIPFAAFLARSFGKPMVYIRKAAKEHGMGSLVEGCPVKEMRVLLVEDLITDAGSKKHFIDGIQAQDGVVKDVLVVFDRLQGGAEALKKFDINLLSITDMQATLNAAQEIGVIKVSDFNEVQKYLKSPKDWHNDKNLPFVEKK